MRRGAGRHDKFDERPAQQYADDDAADNALDARPSLRNAPECSRPRRASPTPESSILRASPISGKDNLAMRATLLYSLPREKRWPLGGIGRRDGLKIHCSKGRIGSTPIEAIDHLGGRAGILCIDGF